MIHIISFQPHAPRDSLSMCYNCDTWKSYFVCWMNRECGLRCVCMFVMFLAVRRLKFMGENAVENINNALRFRMSQATGRMRLVSTETLLEKEMNLWVNRRIADFLNIFFIFSCKWLCWKFVMEEAEIGVTKEHTHHVL